MIVVTDGQDARVRAVLEKNGRSLAFPDEAQCDLAVVDLDAAGHPQAVIAGFRWGGVPVMEHLECRPKRFSVGRVRGLVRVFLAETVRRGWGDWVVTPLDPRSRRYRMLRRLCARIGGEPYARQGDTVEWVRFRGGV